MLKFLLKIPIYLFFFRTGRRMMVLTLLSLVGLILFCNLGPQKFKLSPIQSRIGEELVRQAVDRFPWDKDVGLVMMISDREAWSPYFTDAIRDRVTYFSSNGGRKFDIQPDSVADRLLKILGYATTRRPLSDEQLARICRRMEADTLLLVRFGGDDYVEDEHRAAGRLECAFYPKSGREPLRVTVESACEKRSGVFDPVVHLFDRMSVVERCVWAVLGVVLFPFLMAPVTLLVLRRQSARANALMIFFYSLAVIVVGAMMFPAPGDALEGAFWCVCGIAVIWYLLQVCELIASPEFKRRLKSS